jgi:hypothetical protein
LVHLLVVDVGVGLEGAACRRGAGGEDLCGELWDGVVADELSWLMLWGVSGWSRIGRKKWGKVYRVSACTKAIRERKVVGGSLPSGLLGVLTCCTYT